MSKYQHIQDEAYKANMELPKLNLVIFTFGNVSAVDRDLGVFAIKPSGVPYEDLTPESMVIVDFDGVTVEGKLRPHQILKHTLCFITIGIALVVSYIHIQPTPRPGHNRSVTSRFSVPHMPTIIQ